MLEDVFRKWELKRKIQRNLKNGFLISYQTDEEYLKHGKSYTKMLDAYVLSTKINIILKSILKVIFFVVTLGALLATIYLFYIALEFAFSSINKFETPEDINVETIISLATVLIPAISSLIVAFIKIPEVIAEYLFNKEEDRYMNAIIKDIQDYDTAMFKLNNELKELLKDNKKKTSSTIDESIDEVPEETCDEGSAIVI